MPIKMCESIDQCIKFQEKFEETLKNGEDIPEKRMSIVDEVAEPPQESDLPDYPL